MEIFNLTLRKRLILGFLIAACLTGIVATFVGIRTINKNTIDEVQRKVEDNLNVAGLIYNNSLEELSSQLQSVSVRTSLREAIQNKDSDKLSDLAGLICDKSSGFNGQICLGLDMLSIVDTHARLLFSASNPKVQGDTMIWDPIVKRCLDERIPVSSTEIMSIDEIERENPNLTQRVSMDIIKTPQSAEIKGKILSRGMVLRAACPIIDRQGNMLGALVGGILLNKNYSIVDKVKETVYLNEKYKGKDMGFATIFQGGVRVSTNVPTRDNKRAIGTIVSKEVYNKVIGQDKDWIGRAFVVNDWYISAYTPIYDINDRIIGMLYTGILEAKYHDMKLHAIAIFLGITGLGMMVAFFISYSLGSSIIGRFRILKKATETIAAGDLTYQLPEDSSSCCIILDEAFNNMAKSLKDRDDRLKKAFMQITRTERLAALGQMAAGVAHEINNPLGGILLYSNLILEDLPEDDPSRENLEKIADQTNRCKKIVQNLLDFARAPSGEMALFNINDLIIATLNLVKDQSMFQDIATKTILGEGLPEVKGDKSRLEQAFLNLIINAADAMEGKGRLSIKTILSSTGHVKIFISDTGDGIDKGYIPHIFEPFFTTKDPGRGTGLGLSITYGIIRSHNGFIDVESDKGKGTTFIVSLPIGTDPDTKEGQDQEEIPSIG
ncbi:MAG: cache domain-containing protein [Thermodesulfobacteriota bacterium]|nr:cache domain-containing protein [Thermodesulfobacteriota bacterium]